MSSSLKNKPPNQKPFFRIRKLFFLLTEPSSSVHEIVDRSQARLLAYLLIAFSPLAMLSIVVQAYVVPGFEVVLPTLIGSMFTLFVAYILSRTRFFFIGALLTIATPIIAILVNLVLDPTHMDTYFFVIISILLSSVLLSWRWTVGLAVGTLLISATLILFNENITLSDIAPAVAYMIIVTGLILVVTRYRNELELNRRAELILSENRWQMMINQSPISTVIYSPDGRPKAYNPAAIKLWNISALDLEYIVTQYNILEDTQLKEQGVLAHIEQGFAGTVSSAPPSEYIFERIAEDNSRTIDKRWIAARCYPVKNDAGDIMEVVVIHEDITERKQAEEALQKSERYFRSLIENGLDIIGLLSKDGTIRFENPAIERILGYQSDELLGKSVFSFMHPDESDLIREVFKEQILKLGPVPPVELRFKHKDGTWRYLEIIGNNLLDDPLVGGVIINSRDVTDRKLAEEALRESEERLSKFIDSAINSVYILDSDFKIIEINEVALEAIYPANPTITSKDDVVGQGFFEINPFLADESQHYKKVLETGINYANELTIPHPTQGDLIINSTCFKVGQNLGIIAENITERVQSETLIRRQERLSAVGQMAAGLAHDFNNVIAVISMYSQLLLKSPRLSVKEKKWLQTSLQQSKRAADLTSQILDFSRQSVLERLPLDLLPFLKELAKLLERTLPEHIEINLISKENEFLIKGDKTRIQQMVMNLALNARDAMPNGGTLTFRLKAMTIQPGQPSPPHQMERGSWTVLQVSDTGTGIPSTDLSHLFEPFFTTKEPGQGTGLGLAQVYGIVKQHDAHVFVESQIDTGTTFTVYFPTLAVSLPETDKSQSVEELRTGRGELILIVEDEEATRDALSQSLESLNYRTVSASNGQQALRVIEQQMNQIDLILSDVVMPQMGGLELLRALQQRQVDIPVLMLTGHMFGKEVSEFRALGLKGWLTKPVQLEILAQTVAQFLSEAY